MSTFYWLIERTLRTLQSHCIQNHLRCIHCILTRRGAVTILWLGWPGPSCRDHLSTPQLFGFPISYLDTLWPPNLFTSPTRAPIYPTYLSSWPTCSPTHLPIYIPTFPTRADSCQPTHLPLDHPAYLSYLPTYLFTHAPTDSPTHPATHLPTSSPTYRSTYPPIFPSICPPISSATYQST